MSKLTSMACVPTNNCISPFCNSISFRFLSFALKAPCNNNFRRLTGINKFWYTFWDCSTVLHTTSTFLPRSISLCIKSKDSDNNPSWSFIQCLSNFLYKDFSATIFICFPIESAKILRINIGNVAVIIKTRTSIYRVANCKRAIIWAKVFES